MATFPNHLEGGSLGYGPTVLAHCAAQCRSAGAAASGATRTSPHRRRAGGGGARRRRSAAAWQWPAAMTSPTAEGASTSAASTRATPAMPAAIRRLSPPSGELAVRNRARPGAHRRSGFILILGEAMGSWWRSRDMKYVSLILSEDAAHECVHNLGELGALQFTDLNPEQTPFQRRYVSYIKRYATEFAGRADNKVHP